MSNNDAKVLNQQARKREFEIKEEARRKKKEAKKEVKRKREEEEGGMASGPAASVPAAPNMEVSGSSSSSSGMSPNGDGDGVKRKAEDQCGQEAEVDGEGDISINQVEALIDAWVQEVRGAGIEEEDMEEQFEAWDDVHGGYYHW